MKHALIIGASSGIGEALAIRLGRAGYKLGLVARREEKLQEVAEKVKSKGKGEALIYIHDVKNTEEVPILFQEIVKDLGGFDLIIYCAGAMPPVGPNEYNTEKDNEVIDINVKGAFAWLNEAAMRCERQKRGSIVGISSVAGDRGRVGQPVYCASKAALNCYMEGLRNRLTHLGRRFPFGKGSIQVLTVKPGPVKTPMTEGLKLPFMIEADEAASLIYKAIRKRKNCVYTPMIWFPIMSIIRMIPSRIFAGKNI